MGSGLDSLRSRVSSDARRSLGVELVCCLSVVPVAGVAAIGVAICAGVIGGGVTCAGVWADAFEASRSNKDARRGSERSPRRAN